MDDDWDDGSCYWLCLLYLFYPYAESKFKQAQHKNQTLQKNIRENKQYLQSITQNNDRDFYVKKYDNDIKNLEKKINNTNNRCHHPNHHPFFIL